MKTAIITGASRGIGKCTAELFARNGYNVIINYNSSEKEAKELENKLLSEGLNVSAYKADVSKSYEVDKMINYCIEKYGKIDVLVNNAGISQDKLFTDITDEEWEKMMSVNVTGVFNCTRATLKHMIWEKSGKIINISSMWGVVGGSCEVHYSTSKAAVIGMTKALAKEVGPSNITVNAIAPGVILTDMSLYYGDEVLEELRQETPLMKNGQPEDIANMALYLASDKADFITGQVFNINGGFVIA
ncbi:SDR family oxidoreductase [Peptacetobacter hominis]|uniref:SDR family oxidoreductase n=1 Tax=Peptacetobacter hominis TaxID=2743610 RepID=A0A544QUQ6_9FIRM|nr:SDR family oxidoreductase [Peptacetobacter hominis]TQQ84425.1 SDR family oxidoreductase [Peptacetobacter hominis]